MMISKIVAILSLHFISNTVDGFWMRPLVETSLGLIRGLRGENGEYFMFLGIPYGKVDEENPFGIAKPHPPIDPIFDAINDTVSCLQPTIKGKDTIVGYGKVDCLRLNIYVPYSVATKNPLPVVVWFHGGSFQYGSSSRKFYGPHYLVRHDIILISVSYRLGPFGFLCLNTPEVPGNQGLKDQVLALRWIKQNIKAFGGNENSITYMGESAGSKSADLHVHSNNEPLFHRIIMQGGSSYTVVTDLKRDDSAAILQIAEKLNFKTSDVNEALKYLKTVNPKSLAVTTYQMYEFGPCVEKNFVGVESFLTDNPVALHVPKVKNMSVLMGYNSADQYGDYVTTDPSFYEKWDGFSKSLESNFDFDNQTLSIMARIVRQFYIGEEKISPEVRFKLADFETDFGMAHPTKRIMEKYLKNGAESVYLYIFSYVGDRNFLRGALNNSEVGALHADELGYLFDIPYFQQDTQSVTSVDQVMIDRMTALWTNFAKYGNPTPTSTKLLPVLWKDNKKQHLTNYYMNIDTKMVMGKSPFHERMAFWDLFYSINHRHQRGLYELAHII